MSASIRFIVTDTSPLITLAMADELDLFVRPGVPVQIPDAVYIEAVRSPDAAGAGAIIDWINRCRDQVRIVATDVGVDQLRRIEQGRPTRGLGEQASFEALDRMIAADPDVRAILLYEDNDVVRGRALIGEQVSLLSTGEFLRALEQAGIIQSADRILDQAAEAGRNVARLRQPDADGSGREALARQLGERKP